MDLLFISFLICGFIGWAIGKSKGYSGLGFILGGILGPIGWIIIAVAKSNRKKCPYCKESVHRDAVVCPHCQRDFKGPTSKTIAEPQTVNKNDWICPNCGQSNSHFQGICYNCNRPRKRD
jgi:uncharacterized Zn-finger protein